VLRSVVRTGSDERGAVLIVTALLVPALVLCGALAFGVTTLWTGRQDVQRAADLGALAGAAALPTAVSPTLPIDGSTYLQDLGSPLDATDWRQRACEVVRRQFLDGRSPVSNGLRADDDPMHCTATFQWESPLLATLAACADDVAELAGCSDGLERELRASLPPVAALDGTATSAIDAVGSYLPPGAKVLGSSLAGQLRTACASATGVSIFGKSSFVCNATVGDLLSHVDRSTGDLRGTLSALLLGVIAPLRASAAGGLLDAAQQGLGFDPANVPQVGLDVGNVAPALLTPRLHLDLDGLHMKPTFSPFSFDVASGVTARRVFKSAVVLPTMGIPGTSAWSSLPPTTQAALTGVLGSQAQTLLSHSVGGWTVDPNVLTRSAPDVAQRVLSMYDATQSQVSTAASGALCTSLPATVSCPVADKLVDRQHLLGPFMEDLWDVTRPPPDGDAPRVEDVLAAAADSGEPILVASGLREASLGAIFGASVWNTIRAAQAGPNLNPLLAELLFVPALDVIPATVHRDGSTFRLAPVLPTTGLYEARLVK
jgi:hypothetical protein